MHVRAAIRQFNEARRYHGGMHDRLPDRILEYSSPHQAGQFELARALLLVWQILCMLATPVGLVVGYGGTYAAAACLMGNNDGLWNPSSVEDWIGFVLWCLNAIGFMGVPILWAAGCGTCRTLLRKGDFRGAFLAERMCRGALAAGTILAVGMAYGLGKALLHLRLQEVPWWIGLMLALGICLGAVEYTRRTMRAALHGNP